MKPCLLVPRVYIGSAGLNWQHEHANLPIFPCLSPSSTYAKVLSLLNRIKIVVFNQVHTPYSEQPDFLISQCIFILHHTATSTVIFTVMCCIARLPNMCWQLRSTVGATSA